MSSPRVYVAIDGGNSKTHVVIGDTEGNVFSFVRGPGSSPHLLGVPGTIALLGSLIGQAVAKAGQPAGQLLDRAEVYIAGADLPVEVDGLMKAVGEASWAREHRVDRMGEDRLPHFLYLLYYLTTTPGWKLFRGVVLRRLPAL